MQILKIKWPTEMLLISLSLSIFTRIFNGQNSDEQSGFQFSFPVVKRSSA